MISTVPPLPECLQQQGFWLEVADQPQFVRLRWRRGRLYQALLDVLLLAALAALTWAAWRWQLPRGAPDPTVAPGLATLVAFAAVGGLGYASFRRLELWVGPGHFVRQVSCGAWQRHRQLLADAPCKVQFRDCGNNQGHHCVLAPAAPAWWLWRGPAHVLLWHHRDAAVAAALADWLNQARGVASQPPPG